MSKTKEAPTPEAAPSETEKLQRGTIVLNAPTREGLAQKFEELKSAYSKEEVTIMSGAVAQNACGSYDLRIDII